MRREDDLRGVDRCLGGSRRGSPGRRARALESLRHAGTLEPVGGRRFAVLRHQVSVSRDHGAFGCPQRRDHQGDQLRGAAWRPGRKPPADRGRRFHASPADGASGKFAVEVPELADGRRRASTPNVFRRELVSRRVARLPDPTGGGPPGIEPRVAGARGSDAGRSIRRGCAERTDGDSGRRDRQGVRVGSRTPRFGAGVPTVG